MEAFSERFFDVAIKPASQDQGQINGRETHRCLWPGPAHDYPGVICWRTG